MKTTNGGGSTTSSNRFAAGLCRLWSDFQSGRYDRPLMAVGALEAVGFLLAAVLAAGAVSAGCYAISGECVGGCKDKDANNAPGAKDVVGTKDMKGGEVSSVDAGPQATYPDGADGGTCYADVCAMPKECPADAPPVCWWFCKDYAGTWDCGKSIGTGPTNFDIAGVDKEGKVYCGIHFVWGDGAGALPGTPPPLIIQNDSVKPDGNDGKKLILTVDGTEYICTKVE